METLLMNNWLNIFVSYYRVYLQHGLCDSDLDTVSGDHHSTDSTPWSESGELMVSVSWDINWQSQYWWWSWCSSSSCTAVSHQSSGNVHNIRKVCVLVDTVAVFTVVIKSPQCLKFDFKDDLSAISAPQSIRLYNCGGRGCHLLPILICKMWNCGTVLIRAWFSVWCLIMRGWHRRHCLCLIVSVPGNHMLPSAQLQTPATIISPLSHSTTLHLQSSRYKLYPAQFYTCLSFHYFRRNLLSRQVETTF